jgi:DNA-binding FrmR family transcriptional regulator
MGHTHQSHSDILKRLKRADGHLKKIITMIEEGKPCLDVAQQLQAVYRAVGNAKGVFVQDHIEGCLTGEDDSPIELKQKMREIKEISKYL